MALPKPDLADSKLHSTSAAMLRRERILADTQEKVKRDDYKVCGRRFARRGVRVVTSGRCNVNRVYRKRYLGFGGGVSNTKGFKEVGKG